MTSPIPPFPEEPPIELCRIEGIAGILLQENSRILINELPLEQKQAERLASHVDKMCRGYRRVRRILRQVIIGYSCGLLLISSRDDAQLVLLLLDDTRLDEAAQTAAEYLAERFKKPLRLPQAS